VRSVAALDRRAAGQEHARAIGEPGNVGGDLVGQVRRHPEAALSVTDHRRRDRGEVERAEAREHLAPGGERARHADRAQSHAVLAAFGLEIVRPPVRTPGGTCRAGGGGDGVAVDDRRGLADGVDRYLDGRPVRPALRRRG
jgi:hypothetical protein